MQRILKFSYIVFAAGFSAYVVVKQIQPAQFFIELFAPRAGDKFNGTLVFLIVFIMFLLPIIFLAIIQRLFRTTKPVVVDRETTGIFVTRTKAFQSSLVGIPIYINGKKVGVVDNGKTKFFELPEGDFTIQAGKGKQASPELSEKLAPKEQLNFTCVMRDAGLHVKIDLEMVSRDLF